MKKYIAATILAAILPVIALAQPQMGQGLENFVNETGLTNADITVVISRIVRIVLSFLGLIAVIIIIIGGFQWMTSGGNEEQIGKAKKLMGAGIVGLVIVVLAYAIASFIINVITQVVKP
jgi:ketopantoate hydroxymethyltransferase